uniref:Uncharacterized protein n=1 Tax=Ralstonia solanacearum TaxID=305 RepID=A0A0S4XAE3_RALSL|nr:protein of unknown function [Ralstonia solanacearum]CUV33791.1 protein of unknown function [Ralstonia solanacearum]CUV41161.1 protein of unknown function [Ralstonia solanacearum]CUV61063.1 protein of unknown function [Ralstonia solanacearum]
MPDGIRASRPPEAPDRFVTVLVGKTVHEYDGSPGPDWPIDFEDEIRSRVFGRTKRSDLSNPASSWARQK